MAERLSEACGPGMPGPYWVVKGKQSATGRNPSGAAAPPPFDKGGGERRGQDPSLRNGRFNGSRRKVCGPGMPGPYRGVKGKQSATGRNPSGAAAPPPFDKGGRERRGQDPSLRMEGAMAVDAKRAGRACPAPTGSLKKAGMGANIAMMLLN